MSDLDFLALSAERRINQFYTMVKEQGEVWILTDNDGCVMLTTDDEDGVPVWPNESLAMMWADEDWEDCEAKAIDIKTWLSRWTPGLMQDNLAVMIAPVPGEEGEVFSPEDVAQELMK